MGLIQGFFQNGTPFGGDQISCEYYVNFQAGAALTSDLELFPIYIYIFIYIYINPPSRAQMATCVDRTCPKTLSARLGPFGYKMIQTL